MVEIIVFETVEPTVGAMDSIPDKMTVPSTGTITVTSEIPSVATGHLVGALGALSNDR